MMKRWAVGGRQFVRSLDQAATLHEKLVECLDLPVLALGSRWAARSAAGSGQASATRQGPGGRAAGAPELFSHSLGGWNGIRLRGASSLRALVNRPVARDEKRQRSNAGADRNISGHDLFTTLAQAGGAR